MNSLKILWRITLSLMLAGCTGCVYPGYQYAQPHGFSSTYQRYMMDRYQAQQAQAQQLQMQTDGAKSPLPAQNEAPTAAQDASPPSVAR